jgi:hypothetical protein
MEEFTMTQKKIGTHTVQMAIQAIEHFYKKYKAKFDTSTIVALTIALFDQDATDSLELTPCEEAFRRIIVTRPRTRRQKDRIVLVFGYDDFDQAKTNELNELINRFTKNELIVE